MKENEYSRVFKLHRKRELIVKEAKDYLEALYASIKVSRTKSERRR